MTQTTTASGLRPTKTWKSAPAPRPRPACTSRSITPAGSPMARSSIRQGSQRPLRLPLGARHVIAGWDEGVQGMKVGGVRKLTIPPQPGYGARGAGGVIRPTPRWCSR